MVLRFSAASALVGVMLATLGVLRTDSQENDIVGTWQLVSAEDRLPNGRVEYPFGEGAIGTIS
jgi:Lipocalin-like domain